MRQIRERLKLIRQSVFVRWLVSYTLVLIIPVCCFLYYGMNTTQLIRGEISSTNRLILGHLQENIDTRILELKSTFQYIFGNQRFRQSCRSYEQNDIYFRSTVSEFLKELMLYTDSLDSPLEVLIYYTDKEHIVTQATADSPQSLYIRHKQAGSSLEMEEWTALLCARYTNRFMISSEFSVDSTQPHLVYCNTISGANEPINIFILFPLEQVKKLAEPLENRLLLISSAEGPEIWCSDEAADLGGVRPAYQEGSYSLFANQMEYICTTAASHVSPWQYTILAPKAIYYNLLHSYRLVFIGCILAAIILGIVLAMLLTHVNYRPVRSIVELTGRKPAMGNEFEWLRSTYHALNLENSDMRYRISDQRVQLRAQYLRACLRGRQNSFRFASAQEYFPQTQGRRFVLAAFSIDPDSVGLPENISLKMRLQESYLFGVDNVLSERFEALKQQMDFARTEDGELLLYLFILPPEGEPVWKREGSAILEDTCNLFMDEFSVAVICAVSQTIDNFSQLPLLYREIQEAIEYKSILGGYGVVRTEELSGREQAETTRKQYYQQQLAGAVSKGDGESARQLAEEIFGQTGGSAPSFTALRIEVYDYYSAVMSACGELLDAQAQKQLMRKTQALFLASDPDELRESFTGLLAFICYTIRSQSGQEQGGLTAQVCRFVEERYQDNGLNIGSIADALGRNPKYLSRVFRNETGTGLLDYINEVRIRKAREILETQNIGITELSERVGYTTVRTFRRAFSKIYGTTPRRLPKEKGAPQEEEE